MPEHKAAAVLPREVHGFGVEEAAEILGATPPQVKNWLQEGRASMVSRYGQTCTLIAKNGVCHQCVERDVFLLQGREVRCLFARISMPVLPLQPNGGIVRRAAGMT